MNWRSGALRLAGQWFTPPSGAGPRDDDGRAAVVFIRGSGDSHRDNLWAHSLAAVPVAEGLGVLVPDKRGSGRSEGDWRQVGFVELADDALAAVRYLQSRDDVDARRVGVMGLSQGGQIAPIAAARSREVAFVVSVVGGAVPFLENVRYEMLHTFREEGLRAERLDAAMEMVDTALEFLVGAMPWDEYTSALDAARPVLGDEIVAEYFIDTPDHWRWAFFRRLMDFDPVEWWRRVEQPVLVLLGGADTNTPTAESAARLRHVFRDTPHPDATVEVFPGLGHGLWDHSGALGSHRLHPDVRSTLLGWMRRVTWSDDLAQASAVSEPAQATDP